MLFLIFHKPHIKKHFLIGAIGFMHVLRATYTKSYFKNILWDLGIVVVLLEINFNMLFLFLNSSTLYISLNILSFLETF